MDPSSTAPDGVHRARLFTGICLALIPTGASFAIVSNILVPLKQEFILTNYHVGLIGGAALWGMAISLLVLGPLLEVFGLKNGARFAFVAHLTGITLMIAAVTRTGDPSAFWILMAGAATLAVGNGMIEVAGNPLVAALFPADKTTRLNWFHAFFPIGIVAGGLVGFALTTWAGPFGRWPYQLAVIYLPILAYGWMVLPERFPKTENAEAGLPVGEMFRYTLTHPLFLLMLAMMAITTSIELGPMRWVPAVLEAVGMHGILVLVWISGWMVVLRLLATHFVERLAPTGMLLAASILTGTGLLGLSFVNGLWSALAVATLFAWGVAFFFPTMVGVVSEKLPKTGSLGIVLTAGVGLGAAGGIGVPLMGKIADQYLAEALDPAPTVALLEAVEQRFPAYVEQAGGAVDVASLGYREQDVVEALEATRTALSGYRDSGVMPGDATANALRAIVASRLPDEPLIDAAGALLQPAEARGGQVSFRFVAPMALLLIAVFGTMYVRDRRAGGYRAVRLDAGPLGGRAVAGGAADGAGAMAAGAGGAGATGGAGGGAAGATGAAGRGAAGATGAAGRGAAGGATPRPGAESGPVRGGGAAGKALVLGFLTVVGSGALVGTAAAQPTPSGDERLRVLFLGDDGHHRPSERARQVLPVLAANGIDLFYTDRPEDLNPTTLEPYHALVLYNNHAAIEGDELNALLEFVESGHGLVVLHCASASFQNSEEFIRLVGAAFKSHGTGTFSAERVAPDHPVLRGVPPFETWDETYVHTKHNPVHRTVLEVRREAGHEEPWTWVRTYGQGRVFYTAWGHDERTWGMAGFQELLGRGIRWAIGDWALEMQVADPVVEHLDLDVPLPTYLRPPAEWNTLGEPITRAQAALPTDVSLRLATLRPGFRAEPYAVEPMIGNVIDFTWDERGRMWAVETQDYPNNLLPDGEPGNDRILILEDTDADGRADRTTVFADGLNLATSLVLVNGGLVVAQAPHILFLEDTDGDDQANSRRTIMTSWPRDDTHGTPSNFRYGFDNQVLASVGYNGFRGTVGGVTYERGDLGAGYFRFRPDGSSLDYLARTSNNTWGVALTEDGYVFGSTANRRPSNYVHIPGRYYRALGVREPILPSIEDSPDIYAVGQALQVDQFDMYTAGAAHEIYTARAFPPEYWNRVAFVAEPTGHLVGMFELEDEGSTFVAHNRWSLMASRDQWAAPVQVKVGPDGALWVSDFYTLVAQHNPTPEDMRGCCERGPGNAYETPNRDRLHGRIYRIVHEAGPTAEPMSLEGATPEQLVAALGHDNMFWRMTAQRLLVERGGQEVVQALTARVRDHTVDALGLNVAALHALWTLDGLGALADDPDASAGGRAAPSGGNAAAGPEALDAVRAALHHPAASLRRAALMVLPRDERLLDDVLAAGILAERTSPTPVDYTVPTAVLQDADPKVRLQALLTLSELPASPRAAEAVATTLLSSSNARDPWLPDAAAMAGAPQGPEFLADLVRRELPGDSAAVAGIQRAVGMMASFHAARGESGDMVTLITATPGAAAPIASALIEGIATGWPVEQPVSFAAEQRAALRTVGQQATPALASELESLAGAWGVPDLFRAP